MMSLRERIRFNPLLLAGILTLTFASLCLAQPTSPQSEQDSWAELLRTFSVDGRVNYEKLHQEPRLLETYLRELETVNAKAFADWSKDRRMAFWINAYNAYTIRWILDHYPTEGILETVSLWRRALGAPFSIRFIALGHLAALPDRTPNSLISLADIEHEILRKRFEDPRIHFAIVCASRSCPKLRATPYAEADLSRQLDENARDFMRDPEKNRWEADKGRLAVSKIFRWFDEDFDDGGGPAGYFARYGPPGALPASAEGRSGANGGAAEPTVTYLDYDWSLND